jgi:choline dehydrogenase-like flavoprotein
MCQVYVPGGSDDGFLIETWFSPPGGLALAMPGFLDTHAGRMAGYSKLLCASPVVGTQPIGQITRSGDDTVIDLPLAPIDLDRLRRGMLTAVSALMDAAPVIVRVGSGRVIDSASKLAALDRELRSITPRDMHLLPLSTAHPQGGNALSNDPHIGVVGADFRVLGVDNLRVCDGSVFPMGCDVNPQWTIFALAHLCAAGI